MIQIYGPPRSSAGRCYLALEECGVPYEAPAFDMRGGSKTPEFLKLNPNGKIPVLVDDGFAIWESVAINFYLATKYKPALLGETATEKGLVFQWSVWSQTEFQGPMVDILIQMHFVPEEKRNMALVDKAKEKIPVVLGILDQGLQGKTFLAGGNFTLADLNVASVVNMAPGLGIDLAPYKNIGTWFETIKTRPAWKKFMEKRHS